MPEGMVFVGIFASAVLAAGMTWGFLRWNRRRARGLAVQEVERQFVGVSILALDGEAFFRGLDRAWDSQWRGEGVLLLTNEVLYFRPWGRKLDLTIPIKRIQKVEAEGVRETGRNRGENDRRVFQVCYRGNDDQVRVATWSLRRPGDWAKLMMPLI